MSSPWQVLGAGINGAADGYLERQARDAEQQAQGQATAQQSGIQGPIQPAGAIQDQAKMIPDSDLGPLFGSWGS